MLLICCSAGNTETTLVYPSVQDLKLSGGKPHVEIRLLPSAYAKIADGISLFLFAIAAITFDSHFLLY